MKLWITILIVICTRLSFAQEGLLDLEWKIFQSENDSVANYFLIEKLNRQAEVKDWTAAFNTLERIRWQYLPDTIIDQLNSNAAIISFMAKEEYRAKFYFSEWLMAEPDTTKEMAFLGLMNYYKEPLDTQEYNGFFSKIVELDSSYRCLNCLKQAASYTMPHRRFWKNTSKVIPGMGTMRSGKVFKGLTSLAFNGGILYNAYFFAAGGMYVSSAFWGVAIFQMFYTGNLVLTRLSIEDFEEQKQAALMKACKKTIQPYLLNFNLNYKPIKVYF